MTRALRAALCAATVMTAAVLSASPAEAQDYCGPSSHPDVFYNMYVPGVPCGPYGPNAAQLYVSPRPTPPYVGHTYITYQPLLPHEFLYAHHRVYWRDHGPHGGVTKTTVRYGVFPMPFSRYRGDKGPQSIAPDEPFGGPKGLDNYPNN